MALLCFDNWADRDGEERVRDAWLDSRALLTTSISPEPWGCGLCPAGGPRNVITAGPGADINTREGLVCRSCGCNARIRAALGLLRARRAFAGSRPRVYVTEQATRTYVWMQRNLDAELHGSEFAPTASVRSKLSRTLRAMGGTGDVQYEDVTRLSFADASFDAVVSFDVLEHVPGYGTAIEEFARILKPGGTCIATFPFTDGPMTVVRAIREPDGRLTHLLEPEFHGDPIGAGILCYQHFGWDVLDAFRAAGFRKASMCMPFAPEQGLLFGLWTLVAER